MNSLCSEDAIGYVAMKHWYIYFILTLTRQAQSYLSNGMH